MSNFAKETSPRELDELEGCLLPVAHAIPSSETDYLLNPRRHQQQRQQQSQQQGSVGQNAVLPEASAIPATYFTYDGEPHPQNQRSDFGYDFERQHRGGRVAHAVPTPDSLKPSREEQRIRFQIAHGERNGRIDNDAQVQDIQKANRQVHAINYFTKRQVEEANRRAERLSREEQIHGWEGPKSERSTAAAAAAAATLPRSQSSPEPNTTFGKEYEVSNYDIHEYDPRDYQVFEYKSVYDS